MITLPPAGKLNDSFDDIEEFDDSSKDHKIEDGIEHITHHHNNAHTQPHSSSVKIEVFDDVAKPYTAHEPSKSIFSPRNKKIDTPVFPDISDLPNYDLHSKNSDKLQISFYENTGPTGEVTKTFSKLSP